MKPAFTLPETLVGGVAIGAILLAVALGIAGVRRELKQTQIQQLMDQLNGALDAYHKATSAWPVDAQVRGKPYSSQQYDGSGDRVIAQLASVPASEEFLADIPSALRVAKQTQIGDTQEPMEAWRVRDTWGGPLRCLTGVGESPTDREAVAANDGKPVFISSGPDGQFGDRDIATAADNVRSDGQ